MVLTIPQFFVHAVLTFKASYDYCMHNDIKYLLSWVCDSTGMILFTPQICSYVVVFHPCSIFYVEQLIFNLYWL